MIPITHIECQLQFPHNIADNSCQYNGWAFYSTPVSVVCWDPFRNSSIQIQLSVSTVQCFPSLGGQSVSVQLPSDDSHGRFEHFNLLQFSHQENVRNEQQGNQKLKIMRHKDRKSLPSMPVSQMARSSCMGTRVASCRTASHWSYWKTSARPGPWRCANGLRGLLGLNSGASNFSLKHTWDEGKLKWQLNGKYSHTKLDKNHL